MQTPFPLTRDVVLIGGGHAHALVLRRWGMKPLAGVRLTVINPAPTAPYTGMLPGYVAGHYPRDALEIDLVRLARFAGARLILGRATGIDRAAKRIKIGGRSDVAYDIASIDVGITAEMPGIKGFSSHGTGAKPLDKYAIAWDQFLDRVRAKLCLPQVAVIGGGVAGVELSMAMAHRLRDSGFKPEVTVLEAEETALNGIAETARRNLLDHMQRLGVTLKTGVVVDRIAADHVLLADGTRVRSAFTVGAASARPHGWLAHTGLDLHEGFVEVDSYLQAVNDPAIFATGDCAHLTHAARPKAGVFAVRQAPVLFHNIRADLTGGNRRGYHPQNRYLKLISTGGRGAVADWFGLPLDGAWLWRWKDRIDRKFMDKFDTLPAMPAPTLPRQVAAGTEEVLQAGKPLCGGCGAKVGGADLAQVLSAQPAIRRADVLSGPGDDAALLAFGDRKQVITTDHLRSFTEDYYRMARIAAIHAMGDIWSMGATPQAALATVILPRMTPKMQKETLREIMDAAAETFGAAGAEIVGGHTSLGAELTIGFTVTGLPEGRIITQGGARPGDELILTKPVGTGTILAAEMAQLAKGPWVETTYQSMERAQAEAASILSPHAHAMTDVTGFGLVGHLQAMMQASGTDVDLVMNNVPVLDGALSLAADGVRSSIWSANRELLKDAAVPDSARAALMFDPQTAGGLLAAVPAEVALPCLHALREAGETASIIGTVREGSGRVALV